MVTSVKEAELLRDTSLDTLRRVLVPMDLRIRHGTAAAAQPRPAPTLPPPPPVYPPLPPQMPTAPGPHGPAPTNCTPALSPQQPSGSRAIVATNAAWHPSHSMPAWEQCRTRHGNFAINGFMSQTSALSIVGLMPPSVKTAAAAGGHGEVCETMCLTGQCIVRNCRRWHPRDGDVQVPHDEVTHLRQLIAEALHAAPPPETRGHRNSRR